MTIPQQYIEYLDRKSSKEVDVVKFGWKDLDDHLAYGGMQKEYTCSLLGKSGSLKTWFAICLTRNVIKQGKKVNFFSFEMPYDQLMDRFHQLIFEKDIDDVREFVRNNEKFVVDTLIGMHFFERVNIIESPMFLKEIENTIVSCPADLNVIDYLQLVRVAGRYDDEHENTRSQAMGIFAIKRKLKARFFLLVQLKRSGDKFGKAGVTAPDLEAGRGSSSIEDSSDMILAGWRPDMDIRNCKDTEKGFIKLLTIKNRFPSSVSPIVVKLKYNRVTGALTQPGAVESFISDDNF